MNAKWVTGLFLINLCLFISGCLPDQTPTKLFESDSLDQTQQSSQNPSLGDAPQTTTTTTIPKNTPTDLVPEPNPTLDVSLAWETNKTNRTSWTKTLMNYVDTYWDSLRRANDMSFFCPQYEFLSYDQQKIVWGELWVAVAYYESSYNPSSASVDVGTTSDKDTWSVGLWQMSVVDQKSYKLNFGLKYDDLLTVDGNAKLSLAVMAKQIDKRGLIIVPTSPYWAVLYRGKYDKTEKIATKVKDRLPACVK